MTSGNQLMNSFRRNRQSQSQGGGRMSIMVTLLCWMALAHTLEAHEHPNEGGGNQNRTNHTNNFDPKEEFADDIMEIPSSNDNWFRIESTATSNQCVAVLHGRGAEEDQQDTLIHLTDCDDSEQNLWSQSADDYFLRSKLNPRKCIATTGRFLMLKTCPDAAEMPTPPMGKAHLRDHGARTSLPPVASAAFEVHGDDTIRQRSHPNKCWQLHEIHNGIIELANCGSSDKQHWSATSVIDNVAEVKAATKEAELGAKGYNSWLEIRSKKTGKCLTVKGGEALKLAPIVLRQCDQSESQLWTHINSKRATGNPNQTMIGMIRSKLNPDMCLIPSGSADPSKVPLILWECDPNEDFGSWTLNGDESKSIRSTKDPRMCLDAYEHDEEETDDNKHDVIVGSCPVALETMLENSQEWITSTI